MADWSGRVGVVVHTQDPSEAGAVFEAWCHEFKVQDSVEQVEQVGTARRTPLPAWCGM